MELQLNSLQKAGFVQRVDEVAVRTSHLVIKVHERGNTHIRYACHRSSRRICCRWAACSGAERNEGRNTNFVGWIGHTAQKYRTPALFAAVVIGGEFKVSNAPYLGPKQVPSLVSPTTFYSLSDTYIKY